MQNESSAANQAPAAQSLTLEPSLPAQPFTLVAEPVPDSAGPNSDLHQLLGDGPYRLKEERALIQRRTVEPATNQGLPSGSYECVISAPPSANPLLRERMRNGKIARLPKLERDLVNKLLHIRCEEARDVEVLRQTASAEKIGRSAREEDTPHRNDLPPREELPYLPPGPTLGELLLQTRDASRRPVDSPSSVAQPASAGNPPVTQR